VPRTFRLERDQARTGLALLGLIGGSIGVVYLLATAQVSRVAGLPVDERSRWALRMFGVRELLLGLGLYHASRRDDPEEARLFAGLTALSQLGDLAVATADLASGGSRRLGLAVWLTAPPTVAFAELVRRSYGAV